MLRTPLLRSCLALVALVATFSLTAFSDSVLRTGRLNFLVDDELKIVSLSNEGMEFFESPAKTIGENILSTIPLGIEIQAAIRRAFDDARSSKSTTQVAYSFDPFAYDPNMAIERPSTQHFVAQITPLVDAAEAPAGFFVKVTERFFDIPLVDGGCIE